MTIPQPTSYCIDLHCHSTASDGRLSPTDLVARARLQGVTHLALTDHDTTDGLAEAASAAMEHGLTLISGIELSCVWQKNTIHIVGLDMDTANPVFAARVAEQQQNRWRRAEAITTRLKKVVRGCPDDIQERATAEAGGDVPGRPHFARVLIEDGLVSDFGQAFKKYLGAGKPGDVKAFWPELADVVRWVVEAGGIAVVAHPTKYKLTATKLRALVADFQAAGGQGIEVLTSGQGRGDLGFLSELCRRQGLLASQGSDFHVPGPDWCELGKIAAMPEDLIPVWQRFRQPVGVDQVA